jgi:hypothetical protein
VLVVVPGRDVQVPPEDGNAICGPVAGPCDVVVFPGLSHILRDDPASTGPRGYRNALKAPVSPAVLTAIADWFENQLSRPSQRGAEEARGSERTAAPTGTERR